MADIYVVFSSNRTEEGHPYPRLERDQQVAVAESLGWTAGAELVRFGEVDINGGLYVELIDVAEVVGATEFEENIIQHMTDKGVNPVLETDGTVGVLTERITGVALEGLDPEAGPVSH